MGQEFIIKDGATYPVTYGLTYVAQDPGAVLESLATWCQRCDTCGLPAKECPLEYGIDCQAKRLHKRLDYQITENKFSRVKSRWAYWLTVIPLAGALIGTLVRH